MIGVGKPLPAVAQVVSDLGYVVAWDVVDRHALTSQ